MIHVLSLIVICILYLTIGIFLHNIWKDKEVLKVKK
jgi:hypothetical protein